MIKLLIVDDHQIVVDGLRALLDGEADQFDILAANNGASALKLVAQESIDIILLDINLPDINGFEVAKTIKTEHDHIKIIALTMHDDATYIAKMVKNGVDGYLLKNSGKEQILLAINQVLKGGRYFSPEVTDKLLARAQPKTKRRGMIQKLTRREKEILTLITEELTTEDIAKKLFISPTTVISHRKSLMRKLNAKNTAGLVRAAYEFDLLT